MHHYNPKTKPNLFSIKLLSNARHTTPLCFKKLYFTSITLCTIKNCIWVISTISYKFSSCFPLISGIEMLAQVIMLPGWNPSTLQELHSEQQGAETNLESPDPHPVNASRPGLPPQAHDEWVGFNSLLKCPEM